MDVFNVGDYAMINKQGKSKYKPLLNTIFQVKDILRDKEHGDKCVVFPIANFAKEICDKSFCINEYCLIKMKKRKIELTEEQITQLFGKK